ncbi:MAG: hypothetical protein ACKOOG_03230, partial [Actinomycetota bacterium]
MIVPPRSESLVALGWDDGWADVADAAGRPGAEVARVQRVDMGWVAVLGADGPDRAEQGSERAATGDWVLVERGVVVAVLPRRATPSSGSPRTKADRRGRTATTTPRSTSTQSPVAARSD